MMWHTKHSWHFSSIGLLATLVLMLTGCSTGPGSGAERAYTITPLDEASGVVLSTWLYQSGPKSTALAVTNARMQTTGSQIIEISALDEAGNWTEKLFTVDSETNHQLVRELWLIKLPAGDIALKQSLNKDENTLTIFDPPLIVAIASLEPGQEFSQQVSMVVHPAEQLDRVREKGAVIQRIRLLNDHLLSRDDQAVRVRCVQTTFDAKLRLARVQRTVTTFLEPDLQVQWRWAARHITERVTALGALPIRDIDEYQWREEN